jgi:hypothetical protein
MSQDLTVQEDCGPVRTLMILERPQPHIALAFDCTLILLPGDALRAFHLIWDSHAQPRARNSCVRYLITASRLAVCTGIGHHGVLLMLAELLVGLAACLQGKCESPTCPVEDKPGG